MRYVVEVLISAAIGARTFYTQYCVRLYLAARSSSTAASAPSKPNTSSDLSGQERPLRGLSSLSLSLSLSFPAQSPANRLSCHSPSQHRFCFPSLLPRHDDGEDGLASQYGAKVVYVVEKLYYVVAAKAGELSS